jgi:NhaP-type Na+/H+ and K+/H+ antiporter
VAASFLGGLVARYAIGLHYRSSLLLGFILAVILAAVVVAAIDRRPSARR